MGSGGRSCAARRWRREVPRDYRVSRGGSPGEPAQWVAYVERGCFKYMVHNDEEGRSATKETLATNGTQEGLLHGFCLRGRVLCKQSGIAERVADFPYCLDGDVSEVSIEADMPCEARVISGRELQALFDSDPKMMLHRSALPLATNGTQERADTEALELCSLCSAKNLFKMVYQRDLDHYRYTARSRYRRLIDRCPQVVQMLSLKDIASFLNITPIYLSKLRKEMTYETRAEGKRACTMHRKKE